MFFVELEWWPDVHEQRIGRVHRDGQSETAMAYFLLSDRGSDLIVSDVLGVKRERIVGVRSPGGRVSAPEATLQRNSLELIARMLVGGSFREPSDGRVTMPTLTAADGC